MHILTFILIFLVGSVSATSSGDWSGIAAIGRVLSGIGALFFFGCIVTGFTSDGSGTIFLASIVMVVIGLFMAALE